MNTNPEVMYNSLLELTDDDFKVFKTYMKRGMSVDFKSIPWGRLDGATREETVGLMNGKYNQDAGQVAEKILRKMNKNDLADQLKEKLSKVTGQAVDGAVATSAPASGASGSPGAPTASGIQQNITASENSTVRAPVISGAHFSGTVNFN